MHSYFDITWIPRPFEAIRTAISSFFRETIHAADQVSRPVGSVERVGDLCRSYLNEWGASIRQLDFHGQRQAGMNPAYNPLTSQNGLRPPVGRRLFSAFVFGILRMRIGLMEIRYAPSDIRLPDPIPRQDSTKRQVASWVAHARTRFRELFASNAPPIPFSL